MKKNRKKKNTPPAAQREQKKYIKIQIDTAHTQRATTATKEKTFIIVIAIAIVINGGLQIS